MDLPLPNAAYLVPAAWSFGSALLALGLFAAQLAFASRGGIRASTLIAVVVLNVFCAAAGLAFATWPTVFAWKLWRLSDLARAAGWSLFALLLSGVGQAGEAGGRPARRRFAALLLLAVSAAILAGVAMWVARTSQAGAASDRVSYAVSLGLAIFGLVCIEQVLRNAHVEARWGVKPLCIGLGGVFAFDLFMYGDGVLFGQLDAGTWSAHGVVQACVIPFVAASAARSKGWTVNLAVSRQVVFHSTALLGSGLYLLGAAGVGLYIRHFGGSWGATIGTVLLFAALVILGVVISSGTFRSKLRVLVNKHFFSYRYDYREEWLRFTNVLATLDPRSNIHARVVEALADLVESPAGAIWARRGGALRQVARWHAPEIRELERGDASLPAFMRNTGWVVDLHQGRRDPARYAGLEIPQWLAQWRTAWLVIPLIADKSLIGFVVLADPRVQVEMNWEVLDLLKTAGSQAASYLAQIEANAALLEAEKFAAFNRMSAFVVHDLKNLVTQLTLMVKNTERHGDNLEFQRDMLGTVRHVVDRMNQLLAQLRLGAKPVEGPNQVDLSAIVRRVCEAKRAQRPGLTVEAGQPVYAVGHEDRLERIAGHLVQNAIDATSVDGMILVRVSQDDRNTVLEVIDDGVGMPPDFIQDCLFKPFQTTKHDGMGIGAYESHQYVTGLGGRITVESPPGRGVRVCVLLPRAALDGGTAADLREIA